MSEIAFLIKQLEYCINNNYIKPAELIIRELTNFKAQLSFGYVYRFTCNSHDFFFKCPKQMFTIEEVIFLPCNHYICKECMHKYIGEIFSRIGINYNYVCPGCHAECRPYKCPLDFRADYFTSVVPLEKQAESLEESNKSLQTVYTSKMGLLRQAQCFFTKSNNPERRCTGQSNLERMPCCKEKVCNECIQDILKNTESDEFECPIPTCRRNLSHDLILSLLIEGSETYTRVLPRLRIPDKKSIVCPNETCRKPLLVSIHQQFYECSCLTIICPRCGLTYHPDIPCYIKQNAIKEYNEIECREDDSIYELKAIYMHALSLFEWDMLAKGKIKLKSSGANYEFRIKKVKYIYNPMLLEKYNKNKEEMIKNGIEPGEKFVYHGTDPQIITPICKDGFKIGGIDRDAKIGTAYGYGVYTATDATMSITFYKTGCLLICKGLTGNLSLAPILNKEEFLKTKFNSYFKDFSGAQSSYYVFFQKENVLPYYYIEYE